MHTWDSLYWLAPKNLGGFIKAKDNFYGWGKNFHLLQKIFHLTSNENGAKLFDRV